MEKIEKPALVVAAAFVILGVIAVAVALVTSVPQKVLDSTLDYRVGCKQSDRLGRS